MKNFIKIILIIIIVLFVVVYYQVHWIRIENIEFTSSKINDDFKLVQITDFHNQKINNMGRVLTEIEKFEPDMIAITGDIISKNAESFENVKALISKLEKTKIPIYYVYGNHEEYNIGLNVELTKFLEESGINILKNKSVVIEEKGVNILGVGDAYSGNDNLEQCISGLDMAKYNLMLTHSPNIIDRQGLADIDLIICGHTHGGQLRLPFIGALLAPGQGWFPKYDKGIFEVGASKLYIDSGVGCSGINIRLLNQSQITFIEIKK